MHKPLKTVFMGTAAIAVKSLEALGKHEGIRVELVVSLPDRPAGRGQALKSPAVVEWTKGHGLSCHQSANINNDGYLWEKLKTLGPHLIIVFAFGQFLGEKFLALPTLGAFNIHPSLLPKYRGAAPMAHAILNGEEETGVTIQKMVSKMDAGDIALSKRIPLDEEETLETLTEKLGSLSCEALGEFIHGIRGEGLSYRAQREEDASFAPALKKEDGLIDFHAHGVNRIRRMVRAFTPWPGVYTFLNGQRLKVFRVEKAPSSAPPGVVDGQALGLVIGCLDGAVRMTDVQLEGRRRCSDRALLGGLKK